MTMQQAFIKKEKKRKQYFWQDGITLCTKDLWEKYVKNHDPETSYKSAKKIVAKIPNQCNMVVNAFKEYGKPATAKEVAAGDMGLYHIFSRRLVDCRERGLLRITGERDGCTLYEVVRQPPPEGEI